MLAGGLYVVTIAAGTYAISQPPRGSFAPPSVLTVFGAALVLAAIQGVVLPLYAWWRWSSERDQLQIAAAMVEQAQSAKALQNEEHIQQQYMEIERLHDLRRTLENEIESLEEERARRSENG